MNLGPGTGRYGERRDPIRRSQYFGCKHLPESWSCTEKQRPIAQRPVASATQHLYPEHNFIENNFLYVNEHEQRIL